MSRAKLAALLPETVVAPSVPTLKDEVDRKPEYPKPDTNQMIPFQPRHLARTQPSSFVSAGSKLARALKPLVSFSPQLQDYTQSPAEFSRSPQLLLSS